MYFNVNFGFSFIYKINDDILSSNVPVFIKSYVHFFDLFSFNE